jgi:hypothetical protein
MAFYYARLGYDRNFSYCTIFYPKAELLDVALEKCYRCAMAY